MVIIMAFCPQCGANVPDGTPVCPQCGLQLTTQQPQYQQPQQSVPPVQQAPQGTPYQQVPQEGYQMPPQAPYGAPMGTPPSGQTNTGMLVWSIITIFFCTILGVIALIMTVTAKNELTGEGEQKKLKTAKTLNLIGTIGGGLFVVIYVIFIIAMVAAGNSIGTSFYY